MPFNNNWDGIVRKNKLVEETLSEDKYSKTLDSYLEILAGYRSKIKDKKKLKEFDALYKERVVPRIKEIKKRQFVFSAKDAIEWLTKYTMPYFKKHFGTKETKSKTPIDDKTMKEVLKPVTICDILSEPSPKHLEMLVKSDDEVDYWNQYLQSKKLNPFAYDFLNPPKWIDDLFIYKNALRQWFEAQGGSKKHIVTKIFRMASCKNKAPWASWSGVAWRGLFRSLAVVSKKYTITGEVVKRGGDSWLVGAAKYKSKYPVQSWTNSFDTAVVFARPDYAQYLSKHDSESGCGVILETSISKEEGFLSPQASNKVSKGEHSDFKESEVIRCSSKEIAVKAYINMNRLVNAVVNEMNYEEIYETEEKEFLKAGTTVLEKLFESSVAKKLMSTGHPFRKSFLNMRR